jgi:hypothetical protein
MKELHKFSLKSFCYIFVSVAFSIAITWKSEACNTQPSEIYSTLTTDTIPLLKKDSLLRLATADTSLPLSTDSTAIADTTQPIQRVDTFSLKLSKDTLDAPVNYEASDSGVLLVKEKKFLLYGKTKTTYKDITLTAPMVELNQQTNILTAFNSRDSLGNVLVRPVFQDPTQSFQSDTIRYNFKTQRGLTVNTYTKQNDIFVQAAALKMVNASTAFARRVIMTTCDLDEPHFGFVASKGEFITNKVAITGPIHPEFEGVPIPIYLPFGIFPLNQRVHSGLLPPQFTVNEQFGLGLEGLGYYQVLSPYLDAKILGNIYSYGGWSASLIPTYRKRYRYNGAFNLSIQHTKINFKGDPDYQLIKTFNISWNHSVDPRASRGTNFSANVNAGSTKYNRFVANDPYRNYNNQLNSSIAYSKTWQGKPFNLTLSANHNQNNNTHLINLILPDAGFTVSTLYPFQRKEVGGAPKWYEKIGIGYSGVARNQLSFYDTSQNTLHHLLDTLQWGAQHRFPISMSLPPLGPLIVSPFISYEETWLTHRIRREWNEVAKQIDTVYDKKGLFIDRQMNFGIGINTAIYGTFNPFKKSRILGFRHVIRPTINFNYKPNLSKKYYDVIKVDTAGHVQPLPQAVTGNLFGGYGYGRFGGLTFGVDNNLEMKVRSKKDTGDAAIKKIRLLDGFGFTSAYNFLQETMKLQPLNLYLRTTLFEKVSISAQGLYSLYQQNTQGQDSAAYVWQGNRFSLGHLKNGSVSVSTNFQSKPRDAKKAPNPNANRQITDPSLLGDQQRMQEQINRNPAEFVDFNIPWTIGLSYSLFFSPQRTASGDFRTVATSNISFNNTFSLTPKWMFSTNGYFDFTSKKLTMFTMSVSRDMHCWQMSVNVTPIGQFRFFNISINPKSPILQDLKVNRTRYFYHY